MTQALYAQEETSVSDQQKTIVNLIIRGEWEATLRTARDFIGHHPNNASMQYVADLAANVLGDHTRASLSQYDFPFSDNQAMKNVQSWASALLANNPKNLNIIILNGMLHSPKGDANFAKFLEYFEKAQAIDSKNNYVLESLGSAYGIKGNYSLAIQTLNKAIEIKSTSNAHSNLGVAFFKQGKNVEAEKHFKRAVEIDNNDAFAWFLLGSYYSERNRASEAKPALEKAVELDPKNLDARWNLGGIYFNSGQRSKAVGQLREMIRIAPNSSMGRQAKQMLSQLGG